MEINPVQFFFPMRTFLIVSGQTDEDFDIMTANWISPLSSKPPYYLMVSINPKRYTMDNIWRYGEFVVAVPDLRLIKVVWKCGIYSKRKYPDKLKDLRFTKIDLGIEDFKTPGLKEAVANIAVIVEDFLRDIRQYSNRYLVVGKIVGYQYDENAWNGRFPNVDEFPLLMQSAWLDVNKYAIISRLEEVDRYGRRVGRNGTGKG